MNVTLPYPTVHDALMALEDLVADQRHTTRSACLMYSRIADALRRALDEATAPPALPSGAVDLGALAAEEDPQVDEIPGDLPY